MAYPEHPTPGLRGPRAAYGDARANFALGVLDGSFFGLAVGLASYVTVIPLFIHSLTTSAVLIGSASAIRIGGWQLPQVLTVRRVASLTRYKPMVLAMTVLERLPFFGLAAAALLSSRLDRGAVLAMAIGMLVIHGIAGGFTATAWQAMIAKILPGDRHGRFFGAQSAGSNALAIAGALVAGAVLTRMAYPGSFALCFFLAGAALTVSWAFLACIREPHGQAARPDGSHRDTWAEFGAIVVDDANFRWFVTARALVQVPLMPVAFLTVYGVERFGMSAGQAGVLTAVLTAGQACGSLIAGVVGDRRGHRAAMTVGVVSAMTATLLAFMAPGLAWLLPAFAMAGVGAAALWTGPLAMSLGFGDAGRKPAYIALSNTLAAPAALLIPVLGGALIDAVGYPAMFAVAILGGLAAVFVILGLLREPSPAVDRPAIGPAMAR